MAEKSRQNTLTDVCVWVCLTWFGEKLRSIRLREKFYESLRHESSERGEIERDRTMTKGD